jgi:hypothetical protein
LDFRANITDEEDIEVVVGGGVFTIPGTDVVPQGR